MSKKDNINSKLVARSFNRLLASIKDNREVFIKKVGISNAMFTYYTKGVQPSIDIALRIYKTYDKVLYPYSKKALELYEQQKNKIIERLNNETTSN